MVECLNCQELDGESVLSKKYNNLFIYCFTILKDFYTDIFGTKWGVLWVLKPKGKKSLHISHKNVSCNRLLLFLFHETLTSLALGPAWDELLELYPWSVLSDQDNGACSLALRFNLIDSGVGWDLMCLSWRCHCIFNNYFQLQWNISSINLLLIIYKFTAQW